MADSLRLAIKKDLTDMIEATPGYDLTGRVWRGRRRFGDESPKPLIVIFELPPEYQEVAGLTMVKNEWEIGVHGYVDYSSEIGDHHTDPADELLAAVKTQLGKILIGAAPREDDTFYNLGGKIASLVIDGGMVFEPEEASYCAFALKLTITLAEDLENEYVE